MERMKIATKPLFSDVTWGAGGSTADLTMRIVKEAKRNGHCGEYQIICETKANPKVFFSHEIISCSQHALDMYKYV